MNKIKEKCITKLKELTGKKYVLFTDKGNSAIKISLKYVKEIKNRESIWIPDQAGWMTYKQFTKKLKFDINIIKTECGFIEKLDVECALVNSMPAYSFLLDMKNINADFLINDISGSIGTEAARKGDIVVGSFNKWKPLDVGQGGFIATDDDGFVNFFNENFDREVENFYDKLYGKLEQLDKKLNYYKEKRTKILEELKEYDLLYKEKEGINIIVKFDDLKTKENLINYCERNNLEYTICPREIRVLCDAVSIEIKRL